MGIKAALQEKLHEKNIKEYEALLAKEKEKYAHAYQTKLEREETEPEQKKWLRIPEQVLEIGDFTVVPWKCLGAGQPGGLSEEGFAGNGKAAAGAGDAAPPGGILDEGPAGADDAVPHFPLLGECKTKYLLLAADDGYISWSAFRYFGEILAEPEAACAYSYEDCVDVNGLPEKYSAAGPSGAGGGLLWEQNVQVLGAEHWQELLSARSCPWIKPVWSPDTLLSFFYFGSLVAVRLEDMRSVKWLGDGDALKNIYDALLQLTVCAGRKARLVEQVLYHKVTGGIGTGPGGVDHPLPGAGKDYASIRCRAYERMGYGTFCTADAYGICHVYPKGDGGMVSILIPSKDHPEVLGRCIASIRKRTGYPDYEVIVVDNGSSTEKKAEYEKLAAEYGFAYLYEPEEFNFSRMCNRAADAAAGKYLLFLNDDMEVLQADWLDKLAAAASLPHSGAVGAKLYYPPYGEVQGQDAERAFAKEKEPTGNDEKLQGQDAERMPHKAGETAFGKEQGQDTAVPRNSLIQHAGITNLTEGPVHKLQGREDGVNYYFGANRVNRDMIGVTAACLMVSRDKFKEAGGFFEGLAVAYNDVDLNFRLLDLGYYNILLNDVVLYHYESLSRGDDMADGGKLHRLKEENRILYDRNPLRYAKDAFYGSWMTGVSNDYGIALPSENRNLEPAGKLPLSRETPEPAMRNETLIIQVDHAEKDRLVMDDETGTYLIDLHAHVRGLDSADYKFRMFLKGAAAVYEVPCIRRYREDVVRNLYNEVHVELSGFAARIPEGMLPAGEYEIWMRAGALSSRQVLWNLAAERLKIS